MNIKQLSQKIIIFFTYNWRLKLISFFIAIFLWFQVSSEETFDYEYEIPLQLINLPQELICVAHLPEKVKVHLRASGKEVLKSKIFPIRAEINLEQAKKGTFWYNIGRGNIYIPSEVKIELLNIIQPTDLQLAFDEKITKEIPVRLSRLEELPIGYIEVGKPLLTPLQVTLVGPAKVVDSLDVIYTIPLDLSETRKNLNKSLSLDLEPDKFLQTQPAEVYVSLKIEPIIKRIFYQLPVELLNIPEGYKVEVEPTMMKLTLKAAKSLLRKLDVNTIRVTIDVSTKKQGIYTVPAQINLPGWVMEYVANPKFFTLTIYPSDD